MKKLYKILAALFALSLIVASPVTSITSHAQGFNGDSPEDTTDRGEMPDNYWGGSGSSGSGSSSSNSGSSDSGSHHDNGSHHDSGSSDSGSSYGGGLGFNADSPEDTTDRGEMPSDYWNDSATAKNPNDVTVGTTGGQKFRIVMSGDHTSYQVYHCGISKASFIVTDAKGNAVAYKNVALEQGEDNLWYENITFAEGVDTKGLTVNVTKGDATYLSTELGVSGIKVNGVVALSTVPATEAK